MRVPFELKAAGRKFWKKTKAEFVFENEHHHELLRQASVCVDRIKEAGDILENEGRIVKDRFGQLREHPAARMERDNKVLFARLIRELGLDLEKPEDPRPRRQY